MRVVQVEAANHAVIGGGQARRVRIEESPEFFKMAIDAYQRKRLAAAREPLCNAWDEHVKAGRADVAIEVTLTDEDLIIRDYGPGISDDNMENVFCKVGATTKLEEEDQTGGFGIGAMAPLTFADWFNVTSYYGGMARQYVVSKGSEETLGFPELREMVATPSDEHGIEIQIPLKGRQDYHQFKDHIRRIVSNGAMHVVFNGKRLPINQYGQGDATGYVLKGDQTNMTYSVKVGSVMYPLRDDIPEIQLEQAKIKETLKGMPGELIIMAEPNAVVPTPSRESLSYTKPTIAYLAKRLRKFCHDMQCHRKAALIRCADELAAQDFMKVAIKNRMPSPKADLPTIVDTAELIAYKWMRTVIHDQMNTEVVMQMVFNRWAKKTPMLNRMWTPKNMRFSDFTHGLSELTRKNVALVSLRSGVDCMVYGVGGYIFQPIRKEFKGRLVPTKVLIGERQKDIKDAVNLANETARHMITAIVVKKLTEDIVLRFMELFQPYGIEVEWCQRSVKPAPTPVPREKTELRIVSGFKRCDGYCSTTARYRAKDMEEGKPTVYLTMRRTVKGLKMVDTSMHEMFPEIIDLLPTEGVAIVITKTDEKKALDAGMIALRTMALREIKAAANTVDFKVGYMFAKNGSHRYRDRNTMLKRWWDHSPASLLKLLGVKGRPKRDPRLFLAGRMAYNWAEVRREEAVATLLADLPHMNLKKLLNKAEDAPGFDLMESMGDTDPEFREKVVALVLRENREWIKTGDLS